MLTWSQPDAFWALLGLPLLWWLSRPPRPAAATATAHFDLWRRAELRVRRRRAPMWWRLLLLVIAWCAATVAWAGPGHGAQPGFHRLVVLVDGSASMGVAAPGEEPPWRQAQRLVRIARDAKPQGTGMDLLVVAADGGGWYPGDRVAAWLADPGDPVGAGRASLVDVAQGVLAADLECRVWVLGDGRGSSDLPAAADRLQVTALGEALDNVSLDEVRCVDRWPGPDLELSAELRNHGRAPVTVQLRLAGPVEWRDQQPPGSVEIPPGDLRTVAVTVQRVQSVEGGKAAALEGAMRLSISTDDARNAWPLDDTVEIPVPARPHPDVAVLGSPPAEVQAAAAALAALAGGRAVAPGNGGDVPVAGLEVGCVLLEGGRVRELPRVASVWAAGTWVQEAGDPSPPEPRIVRIAPEWHRSHALLQGLDLGDLRVRGIWRGTLHGDGEVVLWAGEEPLMEISRRPGGVTVRTSFRLADSNLGLLPAWPRLLQRIWRLGHGLPPMTDPSGPMAVSYRQMVSQGPLGAAGESRLLGPEDASSALPPPGGKVVDGEPAPPDSLWAGAAVPARSLAALALALGALALAIRMFGGPVSTLAHGHPTR